MKDELNDVIDDNQKDSKVVHYCFVLDESGSMGSVKDSIIEGFNEQAQHINIKALDVTVKTTLITFNSHVETVMMGRKASEVFELDENSYQPGGLTALNDAIMHGIDLLSDKEHVFFVVLTDGNENNSSDYQDTSVVKDEIEKRKNDGWEFQFMGCEGLDQSKRYGIAPENTINYEPTYEGTQSAYVASTQTLSEYSQSVSDETTLKDQNQ